MAPEYDPKTEHIFQNVGDFDRIDFLRLAAACLDQADAPHAVYTSVEKLVELEESEAP